MKGQEEENLSAFALGVVFLFERFTFKEYESEVRFGTLISADKMNTTVIGPGARMEVIRRNGRIYSHIRDVWHFETPEERIRQQFITVLVNEYGFALSQMKELLSSQKSKRSHSDAVIVVYRHAKRDPLIVVNCRPEHAAIRLSDYHEGELYARELRAPFFVTHNFRATRHWSLRDGLVTEVENIPHAGATEQDIRGALVKPRESFREHEFANLLHECHNIIRNREKKDPAAAFDEIAKILFVKVGMERRLRPRQNLFTVSFLDDQAQLYGDRAVEILFEQTKKDYRAAKIFEPNELINLKFNTVRDIVRLLESYNLSNISDDIKGIAFERFLGRTFRGEIGQFFTPRSIVRFMVQMLDPQEGHIICDPASGSGGFLIQFLDDVREKILKEVDHEYQQFRNGLQASQLSEETCAKHLTRKFDELETTIDPENEGSRLWLLANRCIYGTDANDRMARTSKMNMIMHGDGHGGIHHHEGFLNVNGIFEERFDIVLMNPPFGSIVDPSDIVLESDANEDREMDEEYARLYGDLYRKSRLSLKSSVGRPIASLFSLPRSAEGKVRTELLFIERCLNLLKPGGRLGIVLPEGVFNNPSLAYVREFCEDNAYIRAIISLPAHTFISAGANVKASLLFLQKYSERDKKRFNTIRETIASRLEAEYAQRMAATTQLFERKIARARTEAAIGTVKDLMQQLNAKVKDLELERKAKLRRLLKEQFSYPVFLYEAESVGITATGEDDTNELYPNNNQPADTNKTCLELYREFLINPETFLKERLS